MKEGFSTHSLRAASWGAGVGRVLEAALLAVDPAEAVRRYMHREGVSLWIGGKEYDLRAFHRVRLVGLGKAGAPMARAAADILGERLDGGLVIVKEGHAQPTPDNPTPAGVTLIEAGHPIPDQRGVLGTQRVMAWLQDSRPDDLVICLISGGGSALFTAPVVGLDNLQALTAALLRCGATINEINTLRKHLDAVKGGGLARIAAPAHLATLALSDVVGDRLDVIASGPTTPDPTTFEAALAVLVKYGLLERTPPAIRTYLQRGAAGEMIETPKPGEALFERVHSVVVGSNQQAAQAALDRAQAEGWRALLLTTYLQGEARQAGRFLASITRQMAAQGQPTPRPGCLIAGGETTVTLSGNGRGGRNQELALGATAELDGLANVALVTLATDGGDGPTDAAGAVATGETMKRALALGMDPADSLSRNDAYSFFESLDDLLKPGPTQTNVNDLALVFAF